MSAQRITEPEARAAYIGMGPDRSLAGLAVKLRAQCGQTPHKATLERWSSKHGWAALAAQHDKRTTERAVAKIETQAADKLADAASELGLDRRYVLQTLKTVVDRSLQAEAVLDEDGNPTGQYKFDSRGATAAAVAIGKELGMFREQPAAAPATNVNVTINNVDVRITQVRQEIEGMLAYEPPQIAADAPRRDRVV
jgi:phage terminase small subunit